MQECDNCGQPYEGDHCRLCETSAGVDLKQFVGDIIIKSSIESDADSPIQLEEVVSQRRVAVSMPMCRVGRDPSNDIVIFGDTKISRNQFVIAHEDGYFYLMDLGSRNGTMLNGKVLTERTSLGNGDCIHAGNLCFRFLVNADPRVRDAHAELISYLQSKQSDSSIEGGYEPLATVEAPMPEDTREALKRALYGDGIRSEDTQPAPGKRRGEDEAPHPEPEEPLSKHLTVSMQDELARLEREVAICHQVLDDTQRKLRDGEARLSIIRNLQKSTSTVPVDELTESCGRVLQLIGWRVRRVDKDKQELLLTSDGDGLAIGRVAYADSQAAQVDLGTLVISQVYHWCKKRLEPKGILIFCTRANRRTLGKTFGDDLADYAKQKNVCVMTTLQLLHMFEEINRDKESAKTIKQAILETTGVLRGFGMECAEPMIVE